MQGEVLLGEPAWQEAPWLPSWGAWGRVHGGHTAWLLELWATWTEGAPWPSQGYSPVKTASGVVVALLGGLGSSSPLPPKGQLC